jgi:hypothetical protein
MIGRMYIRLSGYFNIKGFQVERGLFNTLFQGLEEKGGISVLKVEKGGRRRIEGGIAPAPPLGRRNHESLYA